MNSKPAIKFSNVGKLYKLFSRRLDSVLDVLGLGWIRPQGRKQFLEHWALRHIDLELPRGARIGIIGRNGAGKSTLLKLITGNLDPTEGTVEVRGEVQALMQTGTGMHPDFTGLENIRASLTYQGLTGPEIRSAIDDIAEFTELGAYLGQPLKTYSTGMQARLAFATATLIRPDILIVDEVLGVGDGYFLSKSTERIKKLIEGGASVLLVSHAMDQILRFCEQAVWIDRGRIVQQGPVLEVVKAYQRYLRLLDERRLKAKNRKARLGQTGGPSPVETREQLGVQFSLRNPTAQVDVSELRLLENDNVYEVLRIGDAQDGVQDNYFYLIVSKESCWSASRDEIGHSYRSLTGSDTETTGKAVLQLEHMDPQATYELEVHYRTQGHEPVLLRIEKDTALLQTTTLEPTGGQWQLRRVELAGTEKPQVKPPSQTNEGTRPDQSENLLSFTRWPGLGDLRITNVRLLDENDMDGVTFPYGTPMSVRIAFQAKRTDSFRIVPIAVFYRAEDSVLVSQQHGEPQEITLTEGDSAVAEFVFAPLNLGNGRYVMTVGLFKVLDMHEIEPAQFYDLIDRSLEFRVYGLPPLKRALFYHPGTWKPLRKSEESQERLRSA